MTISATIVPPISPHTAETLKISTAAATSRQIAASLTLTRAFFLPSFQTMAPSTTTRPAVAPLKNAEMAVEDDYGMIDGIINNGPKEPTVAQLEQQARSGQPISLMDLAAAAHREDREKKKSVMEQLKSQPKAEHKKAAPKKSAERGI